MNLPNPKSLRFLIPDILVGSIIGKKATRICGPPERGSHVVFYLLHNFGLGFQCFLLSKEILFPLSEVGRTKNRGSTREWKVLIAFDRADLHINWPVGIEIHALLN